MQTTLFFLLFTTANSFLAPTVYCRQKRSQQLYAIDEYENPPNSFDDIEAARRKLESLLGGSASSSASASSSSATLEEEFGQLVQQAPLKLRDEPLLPPPPILTSIDRERRHAEIEYLKKLQHGDEHLPDIWTLWFQERGPQAAKILLHAQELSSNPHTWEEAERVLRDLIDTHGVHWVEPVNRLATLYYMQRRYDEAEELHKTVLSVKPWHFGALSGIVLVYAAIHDVEEAREWAAERLPSFATTGPNRRREHWVEKAVKRAETSLQEAEDRLKESFGEQDDYELLKSTENLDEDAWQ